jgi:tetratricopeptide (TPR) repeat protein
MSKRIKLGLIFIGLLVVAAVAGWWLFPRVVTAMPSRFRIYLPERVLELASTPLPTALPAPTLIAQTEIIVPTLTLPTETHTPLPTATAVPTNSPAAATAHTPTPTPTPPPTETPTPTMTPVPLPTAVRIEGLEIIPQKFNNCGPANLTINLNHYGQDIDQLDIAASIRPTYDDRNVSPWELMDYVNNQTPLRASVYSGGDLTVLKQLLAAGFPVVVEKGLVPSEWQGWMGHYLTLVGYDDAEQQFITIDTFLGPWDSSGLAESYEAIHELWRHFNYTFYLVYPPEKEAAVQEILGPALTEPFTMWQQAALKAQSDIEAEPENAFAWFNLGTNLSRLGELTGERRFYTDAAAAYDQARTLGLPWRMLWYQFQPYAAYLESGRIEDVLILTEATLASEGGRFVEETYLYRGHALLASGDTDRAIAAYENALAVNPHFVPAQRALESVR